jgi:hypothetical protein
MAMGCSWPGWLPLQQRLVRSGAVEGLRYVESLDVTKPGYDLHSLVLALQAEAPLEEPGWTVFDGLPRALRAELLLLLSWLLPRLPREPLRRLLQQFLGRQPHPAHGWDIRIAEELLFQLQANSDGGVGAEANRAGQLRSAVVAVMRSVLYAETVKSLNAMMAKEPGGGSRSWPALASFGPQDVSRRMDRKDQEDDEAPSPKRQRTAHDSEAQRQTISVDKSDGDSAVVSTPAFTLSQEPPQSQQIEWQMPTENPRQRQDDIGETPRGAGDLSDLLLSQAPATTPLAARTQQFVAAPPSLLPMQLQVSTTQSLQTTAAAAPVTTHAPVQDPDVAPIARPGNSAAVDTAYPPAGAEQVDGWAALSVAMKPLRVGIASTAGNDSSEVVDKVVEAIEGARQHLAACVTTLELSTLSDASLLRVATGLLTQEQSFRIATEFIATAILPRISVSYHSWTESLFFQKAQDSLTLLSLWSCVSLTILLCQALSATASRPLLAVCQLATLHQPKATQTHLLLPLLCESNMGSAQAELILRSVKGKVRRMHQLSARGQ